MPILVYLILIHKVILQRRLIVPLLRLFVKTEIMHIQSWSSARRLQRPSITPQTRLRCVNLLRAAINNQRNSLSGSHVEVCHAKIVAWVELSRASEQENSCPFWFKALSLSSREWIDFVGKSHADFRVFETKGEGRRKYHLLLVLTSWKLMALYCVSLSHSRQSFVQLMNSMNQSPSNIFAKWAQTARKKNPSTISGQWSFILFALPSSLESSGGTNPFSIYIETKKVLAKARHVAASSRRRFY